MNFIDQFQDHYDYDCTFMRVMAKDAPDAFETFVNFLPMGKVGVSLEPEVLWTAKIGSMITEDCGACVQLNIKMALESGVSEEIVRNIVLSPESLSENLKLIRSFATTVATNTADHYSIVEKIKRIYSKEQVTELALAIASTKVYPTVKRALGEFKSCELYQFTFKANE